MALDLKPLGKKRLDKKKVAILVTHEMLWHCG
jgi:hypothetical protein